MAKLTEMEIEEVSLVDKPANRKKFTIIKSEDGKMKEIMKSLIEGYTPTAESTVEDAFETIKKYSGSLPEDLQESVKRITKQMSDDMDLLGKAKGIMERAAKPPEEDDIEKTGKKLSAATSGKLKEMRAQINALLGEEEPEDDDKKVSKQLDAIGKAIADLQKNNTPPKEEPKPEDSEVYKALLKRLEVVESNAGVAKGDGGDPAPEAQVVDEWSSFKIT